MLFSSSFFSRNIGWHNACEIVGDIPRRLAVLNWASGKSHPCKCIYTSLSARAGAPDWMTLSLSLKKYINKGAAAYHHVTFSSFTLHFPVQSTLVYFSFSYLFIFFSFLLKTGWRWREFQRKCLGEEGHQYWPNKTKLLILLNNRYYYYLVNVCSYLVRKWINMAFLNMSSWNLNDSIISRVNDDFFFKNIQCFKAI